MLGAMLGTATGSFAGGVASADPAHGVINTGDLAVTQNGTPNMSVNVATGGCFIRGTLNANQGAYHLWNDGTVNLSISAADATNGRRDLVIAQVRDAAYSGATNDARITVVTGTPAASPADPSLASFPNALVLARITVAAGDTNINTADITDLRTVANLSGKMPTFTTQALATTAIPSPVDGQAYYLGSGTATEGPLYWHGSAYRLPWNMPYGWLASVTQAAGVVSTSGTTEITITNTASFNSIANRRYLFTVSTSCYDTVATGSQFTIRLRNGSLTGTSLMAQTISGSLNNYTPLAFSFVTTLSTAASNGLFLTMQRSSGTGTFNSNASASPALITMSDIGPAGAPA